MSRILVEVAGVEHDMIFCGLKVTDVKLHQGDTLLSADGSMKWKFCGNSTPTLLDLSKVSGILEAIGHQETPTVGEELTLWVEGEGGV